MGTYKQKRSRKPISIKTLRLRMQDALESLEPIFLGQAGVDYDKEDMQLKLKAAHAYSQLGSKLRKLIETSENRTRIEALEDQLENRLN